MCATCGCSPHATAAPHTHPHADHPAVEAAHAHSHADHHHDHAHASRLIRLEHEVLARNDALAAANRRRLAERGVVAVNVLASPGAGKTTLLEQTIRALRAEMPLVVIEGDQATEFDADRVRAAYSQSTILMRRPSSMKLALSRSLWQGRSSSGLLRSASSIRRPEHSC